MTVDNDSRSGIAGRKGLFRISRAALFQKGRLACIALAACTLILWVSSSLVLEAFPILLQVEGGQTSIDITVDSSTHSVALAAPLRAVKLIPPGPHLREYQIDGSDTTNNFTFDQAYFASIADSPYYRFQALLRDEGSFSRWEKLAIQDKAELTTSIYRQPPFSREIPLPQQFAMNVQLLRLETPVSIELIDENGTIIAITFHRNDRYIAVTETPHGDFTIERARWFFPNDWLPPAAELLHMLMRTIAVGLGFVLVAVPLAAAIPLGVQRVLCPFWRGLGRDAARQRQGQRCKYCPDSLLMPLLASVIVLAAGCFTAIVLFDRSPHILDAVSYYFQGKIIASGSLAAPSPPIKEAFPTPFMVVHDGRWFSQYPPGTPLLLAAGFLVGMPWLVQPILAGAATLLLYDLARRQYGTKTALMAVVLMASSPFLHLMSGSFLSHIPAMFFATCLLFWTTRYIDNPSGKTAVMAGISLGGLLFCREIGVLLYGLPIGGYILVSILRDRKHRFSSILPGAVSLAIAASTYLLYNWAQTGNPLLLPRLLSFGGDRFGFGSGVGFYGQHTPAAGLVNTDELLTSLGFYLFGWPFYASHAMLILPFLARRPTVWDRLHGAAVFLAIITYWAYFYHGIALGPRYYFDIFPSLVLLSARGFSALASMAADLLRSCNFKAELSLRSQLAAVIVCALLLVPNFLYFTPRQIELYGGFTGLPGGRGPTLGSFINPDISGRRPALENALVTTTDWWLYSVYLAAMNDPKLDGGTVFALLPYGENRDRLMHVYSGREWYRLVRDGGNLIVEWAGHIP